MIVPAQTSDAGCRARQDECGPPAPRVLIIAEDGRVRRRVRRRMQDAGFEVRATGDGIEALLAVDADPPDLIVMHQIVGWLNVHYLLAQLRQSARAARLPILLIARSADRELVRACRAWDVTLLVLRQHRRLGKAGDVHGRTEIVR